MYNNNLIRCKVYDSKKHGSTWNGNPDVLTVNQL